MMDREPGPAIIALLVCFAMIVIGIFVTLLVNTKVVEVGRDPWGSEIYRNVSNDRYYVRGWGVSGNLLIEDSLRYKVLDNIPNKHYLVREYSGLWYWKKDRIIDIIQ